MTIEFEAVNRNYSDTLNDQINLSVAPAMFQDRNCVQLLTIDLRTDTNTTVIISELDAIELKNQLELIQKYFQNLKESK